MGANSSMSETARIENLEMRYGVHVSPSVVTRLENAQRQNDDNSGIKTLSKDSQNLKPHHGKQQQQIQSNQQQKQMEKLHQLQQEAPKRPYSHDRENWSQNSGNLLDPPYHELECNQFEKAKLKLENYFSKPLPRADRVNGEIQELRNELISCHRDHPGELLCCAEMAAKFQELIFREQFVSILKFSHNTDENQQRLQQEKGKEPKHFTRIG
ncbi:hypothetical protein GQX74_010476 [Glossina fuscipes]|nr:hypothetical protein GQX74_010476 [Glossina fuscipes]